MIKNAQDLEHAADGLAQLCPKIAMLIEELSPLPLRLRGDGFEALLSAIVSQQISTSAAAAIWARLEDADMTSEPAVNTASDDALRALGLSRPKVKYAKALAAAQLDYPAIALMPDEEVIKTLITVPGIGQWSAEIYAMFSLGRVNILPAGDLALQESAKHLYDLPGRPSEKELRVLAEKWQPYRSVAARALWAYYRILKGKEGIR